MQCDSLCFPGSGSRSKVALHPALGTNVFAVNRESLPCVFTINRKGLPNTGINTRLRRERCRIMYVWKQKINDDARDHPTSERKEHLMHSLLWCLILVKLRHIN